MSPGRGPGEVKYSTPLMLRWIARSTSARMRAPIEASSAPEYRGRKELPNPEEALVAALSSCHMLTFLAIAARRRLVVERYDEDPARNLVVIHATVLVERPNHKAIVIGKGGERLKAIGQAARLGIEELVGRRVYLELFVRTEPDWFRRRDRLAELEP